MKNKKIVYLLITLVILIWGFVLYRILSFVHHDDSANPNSRTLSSTVKSVHHIADTFSIAANYRDPFLSNMQNHDEGEKKSEIKYTGVQLPVLNWPKIGYAGMIKNQTTSKLIGIIQINGKDNLLKEGDTLSGIKVMKIFRDSVKIQFQKEKRIFKK